MPQIAWFSSTPAHVPYYQQQQLYISQQLADGPLGTFLAEASAAPWLLQYILRVQKGTYLCANVVIAQWVSLIAGKRQCLGVGHVVQTSFQSLYTLIKALYLELPSCCCCLLWVHREYLKSLFTLF